MITDKIKSFFSNEKIDTLEKAADIIKDMLKSIGADENDAQIDTGNDSMLGWAIGVNTIFIYIYLFKGDDGFLYVRIVSPVMYLPSENIMAFYRSLLEKNLFLHDIGFAAEENMILLMAQRRIDMTTLDECRFILGYLAEAGDKLAKEISEEFSTELFEMEEN